MAVTVTEKRLLVGGDWIETGEWIDVRSPYSGDVVGRVPRGGAAETRRALDSAERAMASPLPAHERAAILDRVAALLAERADEAARTICAEAGKPMKAARVEASRAVSTFTMVTWPSYCAASASSIGAIARHGGHRGAQKSTSTGRGDASTRS